MTQGGNVELVLQAIYQTIGEINDQLPTQKRLPSAPETVLVGENGQLDSLGLINLLVILEASLETILGRRVNVFDEALLSDPQGPMATVGSLANYIASRL